MADDIPRKTPRMGESQRIAITVSVPPTLRTRMQSFPSVNWSAVARQAFETALAQLEQESQ